MLEICFTLGLSSTHQDIFECLKNTPNESYLVVSAFHVVEHIPFEQLQLLISETLRVLQPGGLLILETPNPENLSVGTNSFYLDPTHQRPLPPGLLSYLPEYHGFKRTKILRLQESPDLRTLEEPQLINVIYGVSPDYAVIAQKDGSHEQLDILNTEFEKEYGLDLQTLAHRYERKVMNIASRCEETSANMKTLKNELQLTVQADFRELNLRTESDATAFKTALQEQNRRVEQVETALSVELTEKNSAIQYANNQIALMKEQLHESQCNNKILDEKIVNIQILLSKAEEQALLWRRCAEEEKSRAQLLDADRIALNNKITEIHNQCHHWRSIAETVQQQLTTTLTSISWRITRPLRLAAKVFLVVFLKHTKSKLTACFFDFG